MTIKRMFSSEIVRDYEFIDMPLSAQALYFQLGMETDNRGYISNGLSIIKLIGAKKEDLQTLVQRKYILIRGDKLLLQKHFPRNNGNIRADRCTETTFIEDFKNIFLNENGDYTDRDTGIRALEKKPFKTTPGLLPECSRTSPAQIEEKRIEENRIEKKIIDKTRYKHFDKCEQLVEKLISSSYITDNDLELKDYYNFIDDLLNFVSPIDLKIKVEYFIDQTTTLKAVNGEVVRVLNDPIKEVNNKFLYFKTAIERALQD